MKSFKDMQDSKLLQQPHSTQKKDFLIHRPHPWHGIPIGSEAPQIVKAYIEIAPNEVIKYEICKVTGYLKVDRPQRFSSIPSTLYGFIPQTYSAENTAALSESAQKGDGDPLDICVLSELPIHKSDIIMDVQIIGGLRLIDSGECDDKIIGILNGDPFYKNINNLSEINPVVIERIKHYFLTYRTLPHEPAKTKIESVYEASEAFRVIQASQLDYQTYFKSLIL